MKAPGEAETQCRDADVPGCAAQSVCCSTRPAQACRFSKPRVMGDWVEFAALDSGSRRTGISRRLEV